MSSKHLHQNHNGNSRQTTTFRSDSRSISENVVEAWLDLSTVPPRKRKRTSSSRCTTPLTPEVPTPESTSSLPQSDPDPSDGRPCVSLPLTKATLEAMAAQQGTASPSSPAKTIAADKPPASTPGKSKDSKGTEAKYPTTAAWVGERLHAYGMHQEDDAAFSKYPAFEAKIRRIINKQRKSIPSPASPARFVSAHKYNARDNEDTFLAEILPLVISTRRTVASRVAMDSNGVPEMGEEWTLEHYADSGLVTKHNLEFLRDFLPSRKDWSSLEPAVIKAMAKVNGMTNPKPDRTFGTRIDKYRFADDVTISHDIAKLLEVVPRAHNPFFIIEGKSTKGDKAEAENQACRSGAAITNAARMLRAKIGQASPTGVDDQTYIFSATISPGLLDLWVHWVDEPQGAKHPTFHMNKLKTVAIGDEEAFGPLRRMLHNILDWGCADRFDEMVVIYDMIVALERDNEAKMDAATKKREIT